MLTFEPPPVSPPLAGRHGESDQQIGDFWTSPKKTTPQRWALRFLLPPARFCAATLPFVRATRHWVPAENFSITSSLN